MQSYRMTLAIARYDRMTVQKNRTLKPAFFKKQLVSFF
jgi:hypothetical protein